MSLNGIDTNYSTIKASSVTDNDAIAKQYAATKANQTSEGEISACYEKSTQAADSKLTTYKNSTSSVTDRKAVIAQLKADSEQRMASMQSLVTKMFSKQGITIGTADDMWKVLASGDFKADPETIAKAKEDISEDGYWGVSQTSERIFSFALALSNGDEDKMNEMKSAVEKGFKQATKAWGKELPDISKNTLDAVMDKFDEWFKNNSKSEQTEP